MTHAPLYIIGPVPPAASLAAEWTILLARLISQSRTVTLVTAPGNETRARQHTGLPAINWREATSGGHAFERSDRLYIVSAARECGPVLNILSKAPGTIFTTDTELFGAYADLTTGPDQAADLLGQLGSQYDAITDGLRRRRYSRHLGNLVADPHGLKHTATQVIDGLQDHDFANWLWQQNTQALNTDINKKPYIAIHHNEQQTEYAQTVLNAFTHDHEHVAVTSIKAGTRDPFAVAHEADLLIDLSDPSNTTPSAAMVAAWLLGIPVLIKSGPWHLPPSGNLHQIPPDTSALDIALTAAFLVRNKNFAADRATLNNTNAPSSNNAGTGSVPLNLASSPTAEFPHDVDHHWLNKYGSLAPDSKPSRSVEHRSLFTLRPPFDSQGQINQLPVFADLKTALHLAQATELAPLVALARAGFEAPVIKTNTPDEEIIAARHGIQLLSETEILARLNNQLVLSASEVKKKASQKLPPRKICLPKSFFDKAFETRINIDGMIVWRGFGDRSLYFVTPSGLGHDLKIENISPNLKLLISDATGLHSITHSAHHHIRPNINGLILFEMSLIPDQDTAMTPASLFMQRQTLMRGCCRISFEAASS